MANIFIIDDDAAAELLVNRLSYCGHNAERIRTVQGALERISTISSADLVVLDLVMPHGGEMTAEAADGFRSSGMLIYQQLRIVSQTLPIIVYTANQDGAIIDAISSDPASVYVPRWAGPSMADFLQTINEKLGIANTQGRPKIFIVHGQDEATKLSLKNYLQNVLNLPEPIILHEQPNLGRSIIEKFEDLAEVIDIVFVLLTPDDIAASASESDAIKRRARQNVILELGYFLGQLGRHSGRILLLYKGALELPSDISGLIYLNIDAGIESVGESIRREITAISNRG